MDVDKISRERFAQCEVEASDLLTRLAAGDEIDLVAATKGLGSCLEYALCELFEQRESTRGYWIDGVIAGSVEPRRSHTIRFEGYAWCAKGSREQWKVPAQALLGFSSADEPRLEHLRLRVGDADFPSLGDHKTWRRRGAPARWLLDFQIQRPPDLPKSDPMVLLDELREWAEANPTRPIVGPDWQPLSLDQAAGYIRHRATEDHAVKLKKEWLDGGAAIRLE